MSGLGCQRFDDAGKTAIAGRLFPADPPPHAGRVPAARVGPACGRTVL